MFVSLLTVLFIGLKLTGYIAWSWLWVLSPLWLYALFVVFMIAISAAFHVKNDSKRKW